MNAMTGASALTTGAARRVAVIGAGISGLGAALALSSDHHVTLFESEKRLGGHARTRLAGPNGDQPVDTGFIVFNHATYPNLVSLFDRLGVETIESNMSFGASIGGGRIEYGLAGLGALFAQKRNIADPRFLRMVRDIFRFNAGALKASEEPGLTVGQLLAKLGTGVRFRDHYLLPLTGAIWSTPVEKMLDFPAHALVRFLLNHGLLHHAGQHQWYTVKGGSDAYVRKIGAELAGAGVEIRLGAPIESIRRNGIGPSVKTFGADWEDFDEIVLATHSDDSLRMLSDATPDEQRVLGAIRYQPNDVVLHSDTSIMPRSRAVWSSWIYSEDRAKNDPRIDLTYWMNSLQPWLTRDPFFVTLNTTRPIRDELIWDSTVLRHPVFDLAALAAQKEAVAMNGTNSTWFCGAWMRHGFHEDGLASGLAVADGIAARASVAMAAA